MLVSDIKVIGNNKIPTSVVLDAVSNLKGKRVLRTRILQSLQKVDQWYTKNHYIGSKAIVSEFPTNPNKNVLVVMCVEIMLVSFRIAALDKDNQYDPSMKIRTNDSVVRRALGLQIFDVFRWHPDAFQRMMSMGVFESARVELENMGPTDVGVVVSVRELKTSRVEPGVGINSDGSVYGDVSVLDPNFLGRAQRLRIEWQRRLGITRGAGGIDIEDARIGARIPFAFRGRVYRNSNANRQLVGGSSNQPVTTDSERDRDGILCQFGWKLPHHPRIQLAVGPVLERIDPAFNMSSTGTEYQGLCSSTIAYDSAEQSLLPRHGIRASTEYAVGKKLNVRNADVFQRIVARLAGYIPFGGTGSIAIGVTAGTGSSNVPKYEQKALGGPGTLRGYEFGELGRALTYATGRIELRVPLLMPKSDDDEPKSDHKDPAKLEKNDHRNQKTNSPAKKKGALFFFKARENTVDNPSAVVTKDGVRNPGMTEDDNSAEARSTGLPKLPSIVGTVFLDSASREALPGNFEGLSYGVGVRIGGMITVEFAQTRTGRRPGLHFGVVDRNL